MSARVQIELKIDGQAKLVEFDAPRGERVRPATLLPVLRQFSKAMVECGEAGASEPVSCAVGCSACCRQLVPIREMEARRLAAFVRGLPEAKRAKILERFALAAERVKERGLRERIDERDRLEPAERVELKLDYFALGIACPFLEEERCGVYDERPIVCREHLVTSPAAACEDLRAGAIRSLPMHRTDPAVAKLEARPGGPKWIALIDSLAWVEAHPEDEAERRDPREMIEEFLEELAE